MSGIMLALGALISALCVCLSDPGMLLQIGAETDPNFIAFCLDLDQTEREHFNTDPIY